MTEPTADQIWTEVARVEAGGLTAGEALARLNEMLGQDQDPESNRSMVLRWLQIDYDDITDPVEWATAELGPEWLELVPPADVTAMYELYEVLANNPFEGREAITAMALEVSLCPLHLVDYAICFDDENPECAGIRIIHPGHDT